MLPTKQRYSTAGLRQLRRRVVPVHSMHRVQYRGQRMRLPVVLVEAVDAHRTHGTTRRQDGLTRAEVRRASANQESEIKMIVLQIHRH